MKSNAQKVKCGTMLDTAAPLRPVYNAVPHCARAHKEEVRESENR